MCAWLVLPVLAGCTPHEDIRTRYELERMLWNAQFHQRRINIAFMGAHTQDTRRAIDAYRQVVAADPFAEGPRTDWDPAVSADIRALGVSARVGLANLYFLTERYADAGTLYAETLELGAMNFKDILDARMGAARSSYMEGDNAAVIEQCARIFREVQASPEFWGGKGELDDVFMNIPVALVRLHRGKDDAAAQSSAAEALAFYERVSKTWPDSRQDLQARLAAAQVYMIREDWATAVAQLEAVATHPAMEREDTANLELVLGEIHGFRLFNYDLAVARFRSVQSQYSGTFAEYAAAYNLAALRVTRSDLAGAANDFRALENAPRVPDAVASRAILARAKILDSAGQWDEAYTLLRRVEQLYPYTTAAIEAPLLATRHYIATGDEAMIAMTVAHAREFYNSLLDRSSAFPGNRAAVQSALAKSFVESGRAFEAAEFLAGGQSWDEVSTAAGMLKAAEIYRDVLKDSLQAEETLKKVIERFPETRYARTARQRLDELAAGS
jgi:TolA-binding protein